MKGSITEKDLKRSNPAEAEKQIIMGRNEEDDVSEENPEEEFYYSEDEESDTYEEDDDDDEEEDSGRPLRNGLHDIIAVIIQELDERWNEVQEIIADHDDLPMGDEGQGDALPEEFKARIRDMRATNLIFILEKQLFKSDTRKVENRLSIPENRIRQRFLTGAEDEFLTPADDKKIEGMKVKLIEPSLQVSEVILKKWKMKETCYVYALTSKWYSVVKNNSLKIDDLVQIWSFRIGRQLGFVVVRV